MSKPIRVLGSSPLDTWRVTTSRRLRAILFEAGIVDSPELPLYDEPRSAARPAPPPAARDAGGEDETEAA